MGRGWQAKVNQGQRGWLRLLASLGQRFAARRRRHDPKITTQEIRQGVGDQRIVVHQEQCGLVSDFGHGR